MRPEGRIIVSSRKKKLLRRLAQGKTDKQIRAEIGGRGDEVSLQRRDRSNAEAALGNRDFFLNRPYGIGGGASEQRRIKT